MAGVRTGLFEDDRGIRVEVQVGSVKPMYNPDSTASSFEAHVAETRGAFAVR